MQAVAHICILPPDSFIAAPDCDVLFIFFGFSLFFCLLFSHEESYATACLAPAINKSAKHAKSQIGVREGEGRCMCVPHVCTFSHRPASCLATEAVADHQRRRGGGDGGMGGLDWGLGIVLRL